MISTANTIHFEWRFHQQSQGEKLMNVLGILFGFLQHTTNTIIPGYYRVVWRWFDLIEETLFFDRHITVCFVEPHRVLFAYSYLWELYAYPAFAYSHHGELCANCSSHIATRYNMRRQGTCDIFLVVQGYVYCSSRKWWHLLFRFNDQSRLFHSFWAEPIARWVEDGRSPRKTTWPPASGTRSFFVISYLILVNSHPSHFVPIWSLILFNLIFNLVISYFVCFFLPNHGQFVPNTFLVPFWSFSTHFYIQLVIPYPL